MKEKFFRYLTRKAVKAGHFGNFSLEVCTAALGDC